MGASWADDGRNGPSQAEDGGYGGFRVTEGRNRGQWVKDRECLLGGMTGS